MTIDCRGVSNFFTNHLFFVLISGVGKSSLIKQYIMEMDPSEIAPTVGVSFSTFKIKLEDGKVKMQVCAMGQTHFIVFERKIIKKCLIHTRSFLFLKFQYLFLFLILRTQLHHANATLQIWDTGECYYLSSKSIQNINSQLIYNTFIVSLIENLFIKYIVANFVCDCFSRFIYSWPRKVSCNDANVLSKCKCGITVF